jgi:pyruvate dehydrogenase E2 component (dihydrolipoamide acetyltransferase)
VHLGTLRTLGTLGTLDLHMSDFCMPALGADMEAGTLVEWLKRPGDTVQRGDIIAVVDTEKGAIEVEVFEDGVVDAILVNPGDKVPVGTVLARIRQAEGAAPAVPAVPTTPEIFPPAAPAVADAAPAPRPATPGERRRAASPAARRRAVELGIELATVEPTGPGGAITLGDVERAAAAVPAATNRLAAMRRAIAAAMSRSKREIPHAYVTTSIEMTRALGWLRAENERRDVADRLLPVVLVLKAVAAALHEVPELNGFWANDRLKPAPGIHIGVAIFLRDGGLVSPAVHDVDRKDLTTVMRELGDLVARARAGSLRSSELADATITVTNLGDQGVESTLGIIYPPQVALVGFGRISDRPWVADGRVEARPVLVATLSFDHRAVDGHRAGRFLAAVDRHLQSPERL